MFAASLNVLRFDTMNVIPQPNAYDCGVHAIAYTIEIGNGADPVVCSWDNGSMRQHLLRCFEAGVLTRFPKVGERKIRFGTRVRDTAPVKICMCTTVNDESRVMIECVRCTTKSVCG